MKKIGIIVTLIIVLIVGYFMLSNDSESSELEPIIAKVEQGEFIVSVVTTGELEAKSSVDIYAPMNLRKMGINQIKVSNMVDEGTWNKLKEWITNNIKNVPKLSIIGSGGNINKLHRMSGRKEGQPLSYIWLNAQYHFLESLSYEERISELGLNPDRADVIIPATQIFLSAAKWSGAKKIHVPKIGLSDGIIKNLYYTQENN